MPNPLPKITTIITNLRHVPRAIEESDLLDALGLDGLDRQTLAMDLEDEFGIEIGDDTLEGWRTVGDVCATVALSTKGIDVWPA